MSYWVVVYGAPTRQFYADSATMLAQGDANAAKHLLLEPLPAIVSELSVDEARSSSVTIALRNGAAQIARLFAVPPLGARVEIRTAAGVAFAGRVVEVSLGAVASLQVES